MFDGEKIVAFLKISFILFAVGLFWVALNFTVFGATKDTLYSSSSESMRDNIWPLGPLIVAFFLWIVLLHTFLSNYRARIREILFGLDVPAEVNDFPTIRHSYDVALFFSGTPSIKWENKVPKFVLALMSEAVLRGAANFEFGQFILYKDKLKKFDSEVQEVLKILDGKTPYDLSSEDIKAIKHYINLRYQKINSKDMIFYIQSRYNFMWLAGFFLGILSMVFPVLGGPSVLFLFLAHYLVKRYEPLLFGRYASKEYMKERALWDKFAECLKDKKRVLQNSPVDTEGWWKCLAYAYALGLSKAEISSFIEAAKKRSAFYLDRQSQQALMQWMTALEKPGALSKKEATTLYPTDSPFH